MVLLGVVERAGGFKFRGDLAVAEWMGSVGMAQEPLIHSRATIGGGAFYNKGKAPQPFEYLSDADFGQLSGLVMTHLAELGCPLPQPPPE